LAGCKAHRRYVTKSEGGLGLPRVSDREAERRLKNNRARRARRHRAAAHARKGAPAPLTAPEVPATTDTADDTRQVLLLGSTQADPPTVAPPGRTYSPCARCLNCFCREPKNYSEAQASSPARGPHTSRRPSSSSRLGSRRPPRTPSRGPPLLWREVQQDEGPTDMLSWDVAQAEYSQGAEAMSQGSAGSPVLFLDPAACEDILPDLRGEDRCLPTFSDSELGSPLLCYEVKVTHLDRSSQTPTVRYRDRSTSALPPASTVHQSTPALPPVSTADQSTQVVSKPHQATSAMQTASFAPKSNQATQVFLRPPRSWAYTQTERPARSSRSSWTQVPRLSTLDAGH